MGVGKLVPSLGLRLHSRAPSRTLATWAPSNMHLSAKVPRIPLIILTPVPFLRPAHFYEEITMTERAMPTCKPVSCPRGIVMLFPL